MIQKHLDALMAGSPYPDAYYDAVCADGSHVLSSNLISFFLIRFKAHFSFLTQVLSIIRKLM